MPFLFPSQYIAAYNGVQFGYVNTHTFEQAPDMGAAGADHVYSVIRLRLTSTITGYVAGPTYVPPADADEIRVGAVAARIKHELELPRRAFIFKAPDGTPMINLPLGRDDANGPIPYGVTVTEMSEGSFVVNWGVEIRLSECQDKGPNYIPAILSNRWSESAEIGKDWLTTRRRTGRLIVSGRGGLKPDDLRHLVTPPIPRHFVREQANYTADASGLGLDYTFVDVEQPAGMPPFPAVTWDARQSETAALPGAIRYGQIDVTLTGPAGVDKRLLLATGTRIAVSRALAAGLRGANKNRFIAGGGITEDLNGNTVGVSVRWMVKVDRDDQPPPQKPRPVPGLGDAALAGGLAGVFGRLPPWMREALGHPLIAGAGVALLNQLGDGPLDGQAAGGAGVIGNPADAKLAQRARLSSPGDWVGTAVFGTDIPAGLAPPTRGTADLLRLAAVVLKDPCLQALIDLTLPQPYQPILDPVQTDTSKHLPTGPGPSLPPPAGTTGTGVANSDNRAVRSTDASRVSLTTVPELPVELDTSSVYDDNSDGAYTHYDITCHYTEDEGHRLLASTGASTDGKPLPHPLVTLHNPTLKLTVEVTAKRVGGPVVLPDPRQTNGKGTRPYPDKTPQNAVYTGGTVSPGMMDLAADGVTLIHTACAVFHYQFIRPDLVNIAAPVAPFLALSAQAEAQLSAALASGSMLFLDAAPYGQQPRNIFFNNNLVKPPPHTSPGGTQGGQ